VANNRGAPLFELARHRILIETGTEVLAGSTRMQAGTAQKIVPQYFFDSRYGQAGSRLSRPHGKHARKQCKNFFTEQKSSLARSWDAPKMMLPNSFSAQRATSRFAVLLGLGWEQSEANEALLKHDGNLRSVINELAHDRT